MQKVIDKLDQELNFQNTIKAAEKDRQKRIKEGLKTEEPHRHDDEYISQLEKAIKVLSQSPNPVSASTEWTEVVPGVIPEEGKRLYFVLTNWPEKVLTGHYLAKDQWDRLRMVVGENGAYHSLETLSHFMYAALPSAPITKTGE